MAGSGTAHLRSEDESLLRAEHVFVEFPVGQTGLKVHAVTDVSLDLLEGETLGLVGESGCGKSTTGRALMQVPSPTRGTVVLEGADLVGADKESMRQTRSRMQMIFQDPISSLNPRRTVADIVREPLVVHWQESYPRSPVTNAWEKYVGVMVTWWRKAAGILKYALPVLLVGGVMWIIGETAKGDIVDGEATGSLAGALGWMSDVSRFVMIPGGIVAGPILALIGLTALIWLLLTVLMPIASIPRSLKMRGAKAAFMEDADKKVHRVLNTVGLDPDVAMPKRPHEFSGGQAQRICIARALILDPKVIICDEPVSALDVSVQAQILNLLEDMKEEYGLTLVFIAHDLAVVKNISDRVAVMYLGKLCEIAPPDEIYASPAHPYTAALLSSIPIPDPSIDQRAQMTIGGELPSPVMPPSGCRFRTRCPAAQDRCSEEEPQIRPVDDGHFVACHFPLEGETAPAPNEVPVATPA